MTLNLIGLGMTKNSLSAEALVALKKCDKIYLENYTVNFPYKIQDLEKQINKHLSPDTLRLTPLLRENVENEEILKEALSNKVALLVYGDCLSATTHTGLIISAKQKGIETKIFQNASIMTVVATTGLSLYKFGKTTSMPNWTEHTNKPTSFMNYIKQNQSIKAHTLLLTDIGLEIKDAITQLTESSKSENTKLPEKIIAISNAGTENQKIFYDTPENLALLQPNTPTPPHTNTPEMQSISMPFCLIIPNSLSHTEKEYLKTLD